MAERGYFFDSTEQDQRFYQAADFARFFAPIIGNGFSNTTQYADLEVTAKNNMDIQVGAGLAYHNGYMYENDSAKTLTHDIADPDNDRIDRVVVRFDNDPAVKDYYSYIKKGSPGGGAPSLESNQYVTELAIAQVLIHAGQSYIEQSDITDERPGNYIDLHNLKRGVQVNEKGMVTMPNQSFMKARNDNPINLTTDRQVIPFGNVSTDKQGEVINADTFKAKADGIYYFWVEFAWQQDPTLDGVDVQIYVKVNGTESFPLAAKVLSGGNDNFVIQSGVDELSEGDEVQIEAVAFRSSDLPATNFISMRFAKLA